MHRLAPRRGTRVLARELSQDPGPLTVALTVCTVRPNESRCLPAGLDDSKTTKKALGD